MLVLKFECNGELRRATVEDSSIDSLGKLQAKLKTMVPTVDVFGTVGVYWKDSEGDDIIISSNEDVLEALLTGVSTSPIGNKTLRLYGIVKKKPEPVVKVTTGVFASNFPAPGEKPVQKGNEPTEKNAKTSEPEPQKLFAGIVCDGCNGEVRGYRFKCLGCTDFDLCGGCEAKHLHDEHPMIRISNPSDNSWRRAFGNEPWTRCPYVKRHGNVPPPQFMSPQPHPEFGFFPPPPPNFAGFHQQMHECAKQMAGKFAAASPETAVNGEQYLKGVGEAVAAVLNGFGVDVDIDVEHNGTRQKVATQTFTSSDQQNQPIKNEEKFAEKVPTTAASDVPVDIKENLRRLEQTLLDNLSISPSAATSVTSTTVQAPTAGSEQPNDLLGVEEREAATARNDWTIIDRQNEVENALSAASVTMAAAPSAPAEPVPVVEHPNPAVRFALKQLMDMGFHNDGQWLTTLVESKNGDINAVLDAMKPRHFNM